MIIDKYFVHRKRAAAQFYIMPASKNTRTFCLKTASISFDLVVFLTDITDIEVRT